MIEVETERALRKVVSQARLEDRSVGFVATMGYLHEGHLRLVTEAHRQNDLVVLSIFVNPTQFGPQEDFDRYPRDPDRDRRLADEAGVDVLFLPDIETMYPGGPAAQEVWVDPGDLGQHLCGASRPGHFRGVVTVVTKFFNMVQPDRTYFGQKDIQQAIIVSRLAHDLSFLLDVRIVPTAREADGLALSSRNAYLSSEEREQAPVLCQALDLARHMVVEGEQDPERLQVALTDLMRHKAPLGRIDYVEVADLKTLRPLQGRMNTDMVIALAMYFGSTRLIDNVIVRFVDGSPDFS